MPNPFQLAQNQQRQIISTAQTVPRSEVNESPANGSVFFLEPGSWGRTLLGRQARGVSETLNGLWLPKNCEGFKHAKPCSSTSGRNP